MADDHAKSKPKPQRKKHSYYEHYHKSRVRIWLYTILGLAFMSYLIFLIRQSLI